MSEMATYDEGTKKVNESKTIPSLNVNSLQFSDKKSTD